MPGNKWKGYGDEWPEGHRLCLKCKKIKSYTEFHKHAQCKGGHNTVCKTCRKPLSKSQYKNLNHKVKIWHRAKTRATSKGLDFDIQLSDIEIPDACPVLGVPLKINTEYCPSIDRIDPNKGYVKGNVRIISNRANVLKNNATVGELEMVLKDMKGVCEVVDLT